MNRRKISVVLMILILISITSIIIATGLGPVTVSPITVLKILIGKNVSQLEYNIVWGLRLPRVLLGFIVGASLSVTGVAMQALVRNHLADPFILGVSSGASAAATLGMLFGTFSFLGIYSLSISAFLGAAVTMILVFLLSRVNGRIHITHLLLSGVAISMIMEALTNVITISAPNALGLHNATFWMSGSLVGAKWSYLTLPLGVMLICISILLINYRNLNALVLGEEAAGTLGVNVGRAQGLLILISSLLAGTTVAVSGSIGFVGLMTPHITRMLVGSDHKRVLPVSAFMGGLLVIWVDVIARMIIAPEELPVGILTALFGGPFFIFLLKRKEV